jgi:hypothetical protein
MTAQFRAIIAQVPEAVMTLRLALFLSVCLALAAPAQAACFADYKAKQDQPLRLAYGVAELPDSGCSSPDAAAAVLAPRLAAAGWTLLSVLSVFGPEGLNERKTSAGDHFLRY